MLIWKQTARFALNHSPSREQREIRFAVGTPKSVDTSREALVIGDISGSQRRIDEQREIYRRKYVMVSDLLQFDDNDEQFTTKDGMKMNETYEGLVSEFVRKHTEFLQSYYRNVLGKTLNEKDWKSIGFIQSLRSLFEQDIKEISKRNLELYGPKFEGCSTSDGYFIRKYMRSVNQWDTKREITDSEVGEFTQSHYVPNAFIDAQGAIRLNLADESLNYQKLLKKRRETNPDIDEISVLQETEDNRKSAVVHELTHFTLDMKSEVGKYAEKILQKLPQVLAMDLNRHPYWREIVKGIRASYNGKLDTVDDNRILHEAVAIYVTGKHVPYGTSDPRQNVCKAFEKLLEECLNAKDTTIIEMLATIESQVQHFVDGDGKTPSQYDVITKQMNEQTNEQHENEQFRANLKKRGINGSRYKDDGFTVAANASQPDPDKELKDEMNEEAEKSENEIAADPAKILQTIKSIEDSFAWLQDNREAIIAKIPAESQADETLALDQVIELVGRDMNDLSSAKNITQKLQHWHGLGPDEKNALIDRLGMEDRGRYSATSNADSTIELDGKYRKQITEQLQRISSAIASSLQFESIINIAKKMQKADDDDETKKSASELMNKSSEGSTLSKILNKYVMGKESGVHWLSWYDMVKIYGIYKDAILEKYHSGQKMRTYDAAKAWNIYKPLQPDLDKQARSANDEETSKYLEYLEKEGFTYDQLFNETNNEMQKNRGNVNRQKAIIDYAAKHAWLYHMDRFNGQDVYGLDYEGIWGKRSFDELVEHNAHAQDTEKGNGRSKVDTYADIGLLVQDIEHELHHKNIWMVLGIVERLQEKAKYADANTWALVTIINALRNDEDGTLRDVFAAGGKGMIDQIGGIGIGKSAWSLTLFKTQRHALIEWIKLGCSDEATEKVSKKYTATGYLQPHSFVPEVIDHIEKRLYDNHPRNYTLHGEEGVNRNVGQILAARTIQSVDGKDVSIFEDDEVFNGYREYWSLNQTSTDASKTDDDYFTATNGGSDIRLIWEEGVKVILECTSLGQFSNQTKARGYLTQLLMLDDELKAKNPSAHNNFLAETKKKLTFWYAEGINNENTRKTFSNFRTSTMKDPANLSDKNVLFELWHRGFIDREFYIPFVMGFIPDGKMPSELAPLRSALDTVKKLKGDKADKATIDAAQEKVEEILRSTGPSSSPTVA